MSRITTQDILTSQGKYTARAYHPECTEQVQENAGELARRVNALLEDFFKVWLYSGFRTSTANAGTPGASTRSAHMEAMALDLMTLGHYLKEDWKINRDRSLLVKHYLYLEDPDFTPRWTHLQTRPTKSGLRVFKP